MNENSLERIVQKSKLPQFFIVGAMKCGTSTLHQLLAQHPEIFIPPGEPHFFSIDDFDSFPHAQWDGGFVEQDFEKFWGAYYEWYAAKIDSAEPKACLGEDSAGYLSSKVAIDRIAKFLPAAKILVVLRDPVARTYSHYWHWVRTGRALVSFEDSLRFGHGNLLERSYYEDQLRYCYSRFPKDQIKVLIFEEFVKNQEQAIGEVLSFLGVSNSVSLIVERHANKGKFPRNLSLKLGENYLLRRLFGCSYSGSLPRLVGQERDLSFLRKIQRIFERLNPSTPLNRHPMKPETRRWLKRWLRRRNAGLSELLNVDLCKYWETFDGD